MRTLCEVCLANEASVFIGEAGSEASQETLPARSLCRSCADAYYASAPGMSAGRQLIRLSDFYRAKLYDELEIEHPEAFDNSDSEACVRSSELMCKFLKKHLKKDHLDIRGDAFDMLCIDFFGSRLFYERAELFRKKHAHGQDVKRKSKAKKAKKG